MVKLSNTRLRQDLVQYNLCRILYLTTIAAEIVIIVQKNYKEQKFNVFCFGIVAYTVVFFVESKVTAVANKRKLE